MDNQVKEKAKPYFLKGDSDILALLIHGFTGSPYDLRELGDFLSAKGVTIKAPLLPGHGSQWQDLEKISHQDWLKAIDQEVNQYFNAYRKIFLIGYSFGANLAITMARRYPEKIKGIVCLGASVYLHNDRLARMLLPIVNLIFKKYKKSYIKKKLRADYEEHGCYTYIPTSSIYEFYKYIDNITKKELAEVTVPTLIIHSCDDKVTHFKSSKFIHKNIGSQQKELIILDDINHNPLNSKTKDEIFGRIEKFIQSLKGE